jgi:hypothetical protein
MPRLEKAHLFVDRLALGRGGRGQQDQRGGRVERRYRLFAESSAGVEIVTVAEDWAQLLWDSSDRCGAAD